MSLKSGFSIYLFEGPRIEGKLPHHSEEFVGRLARQIVPSIGLSISSFCDMNISHAVRFYNEYVWGVDFLPVLRRPFLQ